MIICIDFDGTCVHHEFPKVGPDVPGAVTVLKALVAAGHQLVLFTMRSDVALPVSNDPSIVCDPGTYLTDAVNWFKDKDIPLFGIQVNPDQSTWTSSPKAYGQIYIDDSALGCPLIAKEHPWWTPGNLPYEAAKPFVNWLSVEYILVGKGVLEMNMEVSAEVVNDLGFGK